MLWESKNLREANFTLESFEALTKRGPSAAVTSFLSAGGMTEPLEISDCKATQRPRERCRLEAFIPQGGTTFKDSRNGAGLGKTGGWPTLLCFAP